VQSATPLQVTLNAPNHPPVSACHPSTYSFDDMVWYGMVWYGMVWYGMVWYGMVWYGMVWYGMVWWGMVWYASLIDWNIPF
jgi:hypothetical protein